MLQPKVCARLSRIRGEAALGMAVSHCPCPVWEAPGQEEGTEGPVPWPRAGSGVCSAGVRGDEQTVGLSVHIPQGAPFPLNSQTLFLNFMLELSGEPDA